VDVPVPLTDHVCVYQIRYCKAGGYWVFVNVGDAGKTYSYLLSEEGKWEQVRIFSIRRRLAIALGAAFAVLE
jgi:hypothetical protein